MECRGLIYQTHHVIAMNEEDSSLDWNKRGNPTLNIMRKKTVFLFLGFLLFCSRVGASELSLKLYGGGSWIQGGDLNKNIQGWENFFSNRNVSPYSASYDLKELHILWERGGEIIYNLSPRFSIAFGLEIVTGKTKGELSSRLIQEQDYFNSPEDFGTVYLDEQTLQQPEYKLQAIPVTLTFYYSFPVGKGVRFFLGCGGGYYFGKITFEEDYQYDFNYRDDKNSSGSLLQYVNQYYSSGTYSEESTSKAFGVHGRWGVELEIRESLHFLIEVVGRWVDFGNWKGSKNDIYDWEHIWGFWGSNSDSGSSEEVSEGKLWMVDFISDETGKSYPRFVFSEERPASASYAGAREAKINLSGFTVRLGFKMSF